MAATASKSSAPTANANGLSNAQVSQGYSTIPGNFNPVTGALNPGASVPNNSGGTTTNVTGQAPQVLGSNGQPIPGAPKLDASGNIIPGTGSTNLANSATPAAVTTPPATTPPAAPLNTPATAPTASPSPTAAPGATVSTSTDNAVTASKYKAAHAGLTAGGSTAPVNPGQGAAAAAFAAKNTGITQPVANPLDAIFASPNGPALQKALDQQNQDRATFLSSQNQAQTLTQQYQTLSASLGLNAINTEMMNIKAVMDGSETDIRNEITKAGGFATNSQVLALTNARNQTNQLNYANLVAQQTNATNQINTMIGLSKDDKANAIAVYNEQMNFDGQQVTMAQQAQANTTSSLQTYLDQYGAKALMAETQGDPHYISMVEQALHMPAGGLANAVAHPSLDTQMKQSQLAASKANIAQSYSTIAKNNADIAKIKSDMAGSSPSAIDPTTGKPQGLTPYLNTASNGVQYVDASSMVGTAKEKTALVNQASSSGLKVITNKNTAADLINMQDAKSKLNTIQTTMAGIGQPGWVSRLAGGLGMTSLETATQSNPQKAAAGALQSVGLDILKAISGVQGFRGNATAVQQVTDHLPKITDTVDTINQKVNYINALISDRENAALGVSDTADMVAPNGTTYAKGTDGLYYPK